MDFVLLFLGKTVVLYTNIKGDGGLSDSTPNRQKNTYIDQGRYI
jgi:hypothetical protein